MCCQSCRTWTVWSETSFQLQDKTKTEHIQSDKRLCLPQFRHTINLTEDGGCIIRHGCHWCPGSSLQCVGDQEVSSGIRSTYNYSAAAAAATSIVFSQYMYIYELVYESMKERDEKQTYQVLFLQSDRTPGVKVNHHQLEWVSEFTKIIALSSHLIKWTIEQELQ